MSNPFYDFEETGNTAMGEAFDRFAELPAPGENPALDKFLKDKNLDISALHRMGARLSKPDVIAWPYPQGLKYRELVTGKKWGYEGSKFPQMRMLRAASGRATGCIVVEGETDAARVTMLYPDLDVGIMGAGAKQVAFGMALQVAKYEVVYIALDKDEAGEAGAAKWMDLMTTAVRHTAPEGCKDWCEIPEGDTPPALPEPGVVQQQVEYATFSAGGITFADLAEIDIEALPEPEILVPGFLYAEGVHWVDGVPGHGKTSLMMSQCRQLLEAGRHIIWLDWESGMRAAMKRLLATGISATVVKKQFHYAYNPERPEEALGELITVWPDAVVVLDSCSKALSARGIDENSNTEVTSWTKLLVDYVKSRGNRSLVVIDHISKSNSGGYSRGAGAKLADTDVHWRVVKHEPFSREIQGYLWVQQKKDREGCLDFDLWFRIGGALGLRAEPCSDPRPDQEGQDEAERADADRPAI